MLPGQIHPIRSHQIAPIPTNRHSVEIHLPQLLLHKQLNLLPRLLLGLVNEVHNLPLGPQIERFAQNEAVLCDRVADPFGEIYGDILDHVLDFGVSGLVDVDLGDGLVEVGATCQEALGWVGGEGEDQLDLEWRVFFDVDSV